MIMLTAVVIALGGIVVGIIYGFPWERIIAANNARNYVNEAYGFAVTKTSVNMLLDYPVIVTVSTKENSFNFGVDMARGVMNNISDDYLDCKTMDLLGKELNGYVFDVTNQKAKVQMYMRTGNISDFSLTELEANPDKAFEIITNKYYCTIYFSDIISAEDHQINYDMLYGIYSHVFEFDLKPNEITFSYNFNEKDSYLFITIKQENFQNIKSSEDLRPYFEAAIDKQRK